MEAEEAAYDELGQNAEKENREIQEEGANISENFV